MSITIKYPRHIPVKNGTTTYAKRPNAFNSNRMNETITGNHRDTSLSTITSPDVCINIKRADAEAIYPLRPTGNLRAAYSEVEGLDKYAERSSPENSSNDLSNTPETNTPLSNQNGNDAQSTPQAISSKKSKSKNGLTPFQKCNHKIKKKTLYRSEVKTGKRIGLYRFIMDIGQGNFSKVKMANHQLLGVEVAVKVLDRSKFDANTLRLLSQESGNMERLSHPNILRLLETLSLSRRTYLVMEYAPAGELHSYVRRNGPMDDKAAKHIAYQIMSALEHMHKNGVIHRDLKAENILFLNSKHIKVGDFGFSKRAGPKDALNTFCGSPPYAAPELFVADSYIGTAVDFWAFGILIFYMVAGHLPFRGDNVGKIKRMVLDGHYTVPESVTPACCTLIRGLLNANIPERFAREQVYQSEWFQDCPGPGTTTDSLGDQADDAKVRSLLRSWWQVTDTELDAALSCGMSDPLAGVYRILRSCGKNFDESRRPTDLKGKQSMKKSKDKAVTANNNALGNTHYEFTTVDLRNAESTRTRPEKSNDKNSRSCIIL